MKVELLKKHDRVNTPLTLERLQDVFKSTPQARMAILMTWDLCSEKTTQALSTLADIIVETEACFKEYINSEDGDTAPLAEAHDILKGALKTIKLMQGE